MNKTNFTPGPWRLKSGSESKIESATGRKVASADMQEKQSYDPWGQIRGRVAATPERKANAALIAAAPELLESLDGLMEAIRDYFGWDGGMIEDENGVEYFLNEYRLAECAIKKARASEGITTEDNK